SSLTSLEFDILRAMRKMVGESSRVLVAKRQWVADSRFVNPFPFPEDKKLRVRHPGIQIVDLLLSENKIIKLPLLPNFLLRSQFKLRCGVFNVLTIFVGKNFLVTPSSEFRSDIMETDCDFSWAILNIHPKNQSLPGHQLNIRFADQHILFFGMLRRAVVTV